MKKYYLHFASLYILVNEKEFHLMVDKISEDYKIVKKELPGIGNNFVIYYAVDDEIPFPEDEEIGFVRYELEDQYEEMRF